MAVATFLLGGLKPLDPSWEVFWVRAGGATVVPVRGDDRITLRDPDGGQAAELTVLTPDGREDPGALDVRHDAAGARTPAPAFLDEAGAPA